MDIMENSHTHDADSLPERFYIRDWLVDRPSNRILREEQEVRLESKAMEVLVYLAQNQGSPVSREQIEDAVWGKTIVSYDALTTCIAKLRKDLGDDARHPEYIETISKKGYRLIAPVVTEVPGDNRESAYPDDNLSGSAKNNTSIIVIAIVSLLIAAELVTLFSGRSLDEDAVINENISRPTIAVLPIVSLENDPKQKYFSEGITVDITTALSKVSGLFVISRSSADRYLNSDIRDAARSLGARYILEGTVRRTNKRIRLNVHLTDASRNVHLWSEKYDRELGEVFEVQDEITASIVRTLSVKLTEAEQRRIASRVTSSIEAYDDYLRGRAYYGQRTQEANLLARKYFQQALDRDPLFAHVYSAMSITYAAEHRYGWEERGPEQLQQALRLAKKGVELGQDIPQAYWALGYVYLFLRDYEKAASAAGQAIELDPSYADSYMTLALCKISLGEPQRAMQLIRKAMLLNPEYPAPYASVLGQAHFYMEQYEHALPVLQEAIDRNINLLTPHVYLIATLKELDRPDDARWAAQQLKTTAPWFTVEILPDLLPVQNESIISSIKGHLLETGVFE